MTKKEIHQLQEEHNFQELQELINTGQAWQMEGSVGRAAMQSLNAGACMLSDTPGRDYWGNKVPAITEVKPGTSGSLENAQTYWTDFTGENNELQQSDQL